MPIIYCIELIYMFVNCFTVTMRTSIYKIAIKKLSKDFGENIPKSLPFEGGNLYFITHVFCVDTNVNIPAKWEYLIK